LHNSVSVPDQSSLHWITKYRLKAPVLAVYNQNDKRQLMKAEWGEPDLTVLWH